MGIGWGVILIVDEDVSFREFASRLFEIAGFSTREAAGGREGLAAAREDRPSLVLLEVCLSDLNGFEVCRTLRDEFGDDLPVVFVSAERTDPLDRTAGFLVGGDDYVAKPVEPDELLARVRRLISRSSKTRPASVRRGPDTSLTERELEVLTLLADGRPSKEIANELVISPKTVASHVQNVLAKLGAHSRAEAVAIAFRDGFVASEAATARPDGEVTAHLGAVLSKEPG